MHPSMEMQMQANMTMLMGMLAKQQAEFQKQMLDMEARQKRELTNILQSQQTAQSSSNRVGHPLSPNINYSATLWERMFPSTSSKCAEMIASGVPIV